MKRLIEKNRRRLNEEMQSYEQRRFFSPAMYSSDQLIEPAILTYVRGKLIDIGCGDMPYKNLILKRATQYDTFDVERRVPDVKFVGDIHDMSMLADSSYDTVVCFAVLEHVKNPFQAMTEVGRILKEDGTLLLSVPHFTRVHEAPNDFFRYTRYGIQSVLESTGFEILEITATGGLFSFLGHQISTVVVCLSWHIPVVKRVVFFLNKWLCVKLCYWLDQVFDKGKIFALGYLCVAKKRNGARSSKSPS